MKLSLLLCGAALLVAGCESSRNPYASSEEYMFNYDMVPQPIPGITPGELDKILQAQPMEPVYFRQDPGYIRH